MCERAPYRSILVLLALARMGFPVWSGSQAWGDPTFKNPHRLRNNRATKHRLSWLAPSRSPKLLLSQLPLLVCGACLPGDSP